jgi:GAF domain-containing protein
MTTAAAATSTADASRIGLDSPLAAVGTLAREMFSEATLEDTVDKILDLAVQTFDCTDAGLLLVGERDAAVAKAATSASASVADSIQIESRQGPGLQAINRQQPVIVTELRFDSRWRFWAPQAADLGFRSVLSLSLSDGDTSGALNLYSSSAASFDTSTLAMGQVFASHAAIAIAIAHERQQLLKAIESRGVLGQAEGVLMERYGISADQASTILRRYATHLDQKLRVVAAAVVRDRRLPELDVEDLAAGPTA